MKTILSFILALVLCLFLGPAAYAQHGHGGGGGQRGGGQHAGAGPHNSGPARGGNQGVHAPGHFPGDAGRHETNESRQHFDGRHFDAGFRGQYFGRGHSFYVGRPIWYGGGYRFWYGGFWFGYDAWPYGWGYGDPVYIDCDGDVYYLYNPYHPGVRIGLNIVF